MNPRQRRGVLLMLMSAVGAIAVFFVVLSYVGRVNAEVGTRVTAYELSHDLDALTPLTPKDFKAVSVPERWLPAAAVRDLSKVSGQVASTKLSAGSLLQTGMAQPPPELAPGERELAILIDAETGVAGKITPGDTVDIYATFGGTTGSAQTEDEAEIVVTNARVLDVGKLENVDNADKSGVTTRSQVVPITFALSVNDSLQLAYAESFATKVRLALIAPGSKSNVLDGTKLTSEQAVGAKAAVATPSTPGGTS